MNIIAFFEFFSSVYSLLHNSTLITVSCSTYQYTAQNLRLPLAGCVNHKCLFALQQLMFDDKSSIAAKTHKKIFMSLWNPLLYVWNTAWEAIISTRRNVHWNIKREKDIFRFQVFVSYIADCSFDEIFPSLSVELRVAVLLKKLCKQNNFFHLASI